MQELRALQAAHAWPSAWEFGELKSWRRRDVVLEHPDTMPGARWLSGARLNFAVNRD